jgi:hypothetical protein
MRTLKGLILALITTFTLAGCGGGGDGGGSLSSPTPSVAYFEFNGYTWSGTTAEVFSNPPAFGGNVNEIDASEYCSQQTCDVDQYGKSVNCRATNFNKQVGWSMPSESQLVAFCQAFLKAPLSGWTQGPTWASCGSTGCKTINFSDGCKTATYINNPFGIKGHVTCIKKKE